jgi:hypothetical protein
MGHFDRRERKKGASEVDVTDITKLRAFMKSTVGKVMKAQHADIFLYPVDSSVYPDYYEAIEHPMDLTRIKDRIPSYCKFEDFLVDLSLVWRNCRKYNAPGSDIIAWVHELRDIAHGLIIEKFGSRFDAYFSETYVSDINAPNPSSKQTKNIS